MLSVFRLQFREPDRAVSVMAKQKAGQLRGLFIIDLGGKTFCPQEVSRLAVGPSKSRVRFRAIFVGDKSTGGG